MINCCCLFVYNTIKLVSEQLSATKINLFSAPLLLCKATLNRPYFGDSLYTDELHVQELPEWIHKGLSFFNFSDIKSLIILQQNKFLCYFFGFLFQKLFASVSYNSVQNI